MMTDPVADMLTRIRNALAIERTGVDMPSSKLKVGIADTLKREGYIWDYEVVKNQPQDVLHLHLKYGNNGERVIQHIQRTSKPGRREYTNRDNLPKVLNGLGICILSTNQGVMSNREAKQKGVGGEILCTIW